MSINIKLKLTQIQILYDNRYMYIQHIAIAVVVMI